MKIYICEKDFNKSKYLNAYFDEFKNIEVINNDFKSFIKKNKVECVVLSNNAYGLFDYGLSKEIIDYYEGIESKIQKFIIDNYNGEQPTPPTPVTPGFTETQDILINEVKYGTITMYS